MATATNTLNCVILLSLATINLVAGNILPSALGFRPLDHNQKRSSVVAQSNLDELNCKSPFKAVGSLCLHFMVQADDISAEWVCDVLGGHLVVIDTATKLFDVVEYINANYSRHESYKIDGRRDSFNQWSFANVDREFPMGTPFWGTTKNDLVQRPLDNSGDCLTISYDNSYYFTESICGSNGPLPLCEQKGEADHDGTRGTIVSPNYPNNYPNLDHSEWSITAEEDAKITVNFEEFSTEKGFDYLTISDGIDGKAPQLIHLTGDPSSIREVTSTGNALHFKFNSDYSVSSSGFKLNWSASSESEIVDFTCPPFYTPVGQDCFAFVFVPMTFNEAKITCAAANAQLGVVSNAEQLRSLYLFINDLGITDDSFWLGGSDQNDEGHFVYEDGTDVPQGTPFWGTKGVGVQEPDGGEKQNCVALVASGSHFLRDVKCSKRMMSLCSPL